MEKRTVYRNINKKLIAYWILYTLCFSGAYVYLKQSFLWEEYFHARSLFLIFSVGYLLILIWKSMCSIECIKLRSDSIILVKCFMPWGTIKLSGKPFVSATVIVGENEGGLTAMNIYTKKRKHPIECIITMKLYFLISSSPIPDNSYVNKPWVKPQAEDDRPMSVIPDHSSPVIDELMDVSDVMKVLYCKNYHEAIKEYYSVEITDEALFNYRGKEKYF